MTHLYLTILDGTHQIGGYFLFRVFSESQNCCKRKMIDTLNGFTEEPSSLHPSTPIVIQQLNPKSSWEHCHKCHSLSAQPLISCTSVAETARDATSSLMASLQNISLICWVSRVAISTGPVLVRFPYPPTIPTTLFICFLYQSLI